MLFHNCSSHIHNLQIVTQNFPHLVFSSTHKTHNHYNTHFRKRLRADTFLSLSRLVDFTTHLKESGSMLSRIQNSFSPTLAQHMLQTTCTAPRSNVCVFVCVRERERGQTRAKRQLSKTAASAKWSSVCVRICQHSRVRAEQPVVGRAGWMCHCCRLKHWSVSIVCSNTFDVCLLRTDDYASSMNWNEATKR